MAVGTGLGVGLMDIQPGRLSPAFLISQKSEIFDSFPPGEAFWCGCEIGLRAEVVFGPYGMGNSAIVVVGATIMSPVAHRLV